MTALVLCSACKGKRQFNIEPSKNADTTNCVEIIRFDSAMLSVDTAKIYSSTLDLYNKYPDFFPLYVINILDENPADTAVVASLIKEFVSDNEFNRINNMALEKFSDATPYVQQLDKAFAGINQYFPEIQIPKLYFYVSGFNRAIMYNRAILGVGIDLYIDNQLPEYQDIAYDYMTERMCPSAIVPDIVATILFASFPYNSQHERLLDAMLYRGKILYLLSVFLPDIAPNEIIGYSKFQWEWSRKYEAQIWETILDNDDLYSTNNMTIRKYIEPSPFTAPIAQESPGRLGVWLGWQIVNSYMNNNAQTTLQDLMHESNYQQILQMAKYKP
ncbi:MAG: hypothetical protein LBV75_02805 [Paludibacter sp.]|nr:hypothetical protein [Paludibacter sp.]